MDVDTILDREYNIIDNIDYVHYIIYDNMVGGAEVNKLHQLIFEFGASLIY